MEKLTVIEVALLAGVSRPTVRTKLTQMCVQCLSFRLVSKLRDMVLLKGHAVMNHMVGIAGSDQIPKKPREALPAFDAFVRRIRDILMHHRLNQAGNNITPGKSND